MKRDLFRSWFWCHIRSSLFIKICNFLSLVNFLQAAGYDDLPAVLFMAGGNLVGLMHRIICKIWQEENMFTHWDLSVLCPVLKKENLVMFANYSDKILLPIPFKALTKVLCDRLKLIAKILI